MKKMMVILMLIPVFALAQKQVALIDPSLERPVTFVSALKMEHLLKGDFALSTDNMSIVAENVRKFRALIDDKKDLPADMKSIVKGTTYFTASGKNGDFNIVIDSKIDKMGTYFVLTDKSKSRKENLEGIDKFLAYLERSGK